MQTNKWYTWLNRWHNYTNYNCIYFIRDIYLEELKLDIQPIINSIMKPEFTISKWQYYYTLDYLSTCLLEAQCTSIDLMDIQEYDVILFKDRHNRPIHWALYIGQNKIIHLPENSNARITELNDDYRPQIFKIFRLKCVDL